MCDLLDKISTKKKKKPAYNQKHLYPNMKGVKINANFLLTF